jgi:uncharacterized protein YjdB
MKQALIRTSKSLFTGYLPLLATILCLNLSACKDDDSAVKVSAIAVKEAIYENGVMQISLKSNASLQLTPFILPQNAANKTVAFSNKYPGLMDVSASGLITAKAAGIDTLTIRTTDGSGVKVSYKIKISD